MFISPLLSSTSLTTSRTSILLGSSRSLLSFLTASLNPFAYYSRKKLFIFRGLSLRSTGSLTLKSRMLMLISFFIRYLLASLIRLSGPKDNSIKTEKFWCYSLFPDSSSKIKDLTLNPQSWVRTMTSMLYLRENISILFMA